MHGEDFLNRLYKDLNLSDEVRHTAKGISNKDEAVRKYMDRLDRVHTKAKVKKEHMDKLKYLYHRKYVVKPEDIPHYRDKARIIKAQEESLDKWLDYLLDENARYPMWAKYWVFHGMLKIGTYDEANDVYQKRSKKTLAPFIAVDPEIVAKCIGTVQEYLSGKILNDCELNQLIESSNFSKLYFMFQKKKKNLLIESSDKYDGCWIIYHHETEEEADLKKFRGLEPEYLKLYYSLQGYNTGWCTAGDKSTAKDQICGISDYLGGDFYVYYTKNQDGKYVIPRIAIRMDGKSIGEIRGIADGQNMEEGLEDVVEDKLKNISGISNKDIDDALVKVNNMRRLTILNRKNNRGEEFSAKDINFIYELDNTIDGFGWEGDSRIDRIIESRNIADDYKKIRSKAKRVNFLVNISFKYNNVLIHETDEKVLLKAIEEDYYTFQYADESLKYNKDFLLKAIEKNVYVLNMIDVKWKQDKNFMLEAVQRCYYALKYASLELKKDFDVVLASVCSDLNALQYADESLKSNLDFLMMIVRQKSFKLSNLYKSNLDKDLIMELYLVRKKYSIISKKNHSGRCR